MTGPEIDRATGTVTGVDGLQDSRERSATEEAAAPFWVPALIAKVRGEAFSRLLDYCRNEDEMMIAERLEKARRKIGTALAMGLPPSDPSIRELQASAERDEEDLRKSSDLAWQVAEDVAEFALAQLLKRDGINWNYIFGPDCYDAQKAARAEIDADALTRWPDSDPDDPDRELPEKVRWFREKIRRTAANRVREWLADLAFLAGGPDEAFSMSLSEADAVVATLSDTHRERLFSSRLDAAKTEARTARQDLEAEIRDYYA